MLRLALLATMLILPGCADLALDRGSVAPELAWDAVAAVDMGQTVTIAREPSLYSETNEVLGPHPTPEHVEAYFAAFAALHYAGSVWLDREVDATDSKAWRAVRWGWRLLTIEDETRAVVHNFAIGITPYAPVQRSPK